MPKTLLNIEIRRWERKRAIKRRKENAGKFMRRKIISWYNKLFVTRQRMFTKVVSFKSDSDPVHYQKLLEPVLIHSYHLYTYKGKIQLSNKSPKNLVASICLVNWEVI